MEMYSGRSSGWGDGAADREHSHSGTVDRAIPSCELTPGELPTLIARKHPILTQPCLSLEGMRLTWQPQGGLLHGFSRCRSREG